MTTPGGACLLPLPLPDSLIERSVLFAVRRMAAHGVRDVSAAWLILDAFSTGFEIRYQHAKGDLGSDFAAPKIDLGGWTYNFTAGVRF